MREYKRGEGEYSLQESLRDSTRRARHVEQEAFLRKRVPELHAQGLATVVIAKRLRVSAHTVLRHMRQLGLAPLATKG